MSGDKGDSIRVFRLTTHLFEVFKLEHVHDGSYNRINVIRINR